VSEFALPVSTPLGLLARILSLAVNLEALSPRPKIPFLADKAWRRHEAFAAQALNAGGVGKAGVLGRALLLRIQPERFELPTPFRRSIAQPLDIDAPRQAALHGSADQLGSKKGERDGHVDMTDAASLAQCNLLSASDGTRDDFTSALLGGGYPRRQKDR
jgi:hypothetical protein